jgi:hypothetical protein
VADARPYGVVYGEQVHQQVASLPKQARLALADALERVAVAPWAEPRYHPRLPEEMRTVVFGEWGFAVYVISERRHLVILAYLTWAD